MTGYTKLFQSLCRSNRSVHVQLFERIPVSRLM